MGRTRSFPESTPILAAALVLALCGWGCQQGGTAILLVSNLPTDTATLQVLASLDGRDAQESPVFDLSDRVITGETGYRFGLRLPEGSAGLLAIGVAAMDRRGCLLAIGEALAPDILTISPDPAISVTLLMLSQEEVLRCAQSQPVIRALEPDPDAISAAAPAERRVRGWGFRQGATVTVATIPEANAAQACAQDRCPADGQPASGSRVSPTEMRFSQPAQQGPSGRDTLCVIVRNSDGRGACQLSASYRHTFAATPYDLGGSLHPNSLAVGDLDGDGLLDVAFSAVELPADPSRRGVVATMRNVGQGRLGPPAVVLRTGYATSVALADLDRDGKLDLLATTRPLDQEGGEVLVYKNRAGSFAQTPDARRAAGIRPDSLVATDLNGDGVPDAVVVNDPFNATAIYSNKISVLQGNPDGTLGSPLTLVAGTAIGFVRAGDLNGDGLPDLAITGLQLDLVDGKIKVSGSVTVLANLTDKMAAGRPLRFVNVEATGDVRVALLERSYAVAGLFAGLAFGDLDGDGRDDVVVSGQTLGGSTPESSTEGNLISVLRHLGASGEMGLLATAKDYVAGRAPFGVALADLNGDGQRDVVLANVREGQPGRITLLLNQRSGDARFLPQDLPSYPGGVGSSVVEVADLDRDGKPDLILASLGLPDDKDAQRRRPGAITVYRNTTR